MSSNPADIIPEASQPPRKRSGCFRFLIDVLETLVLSVVLFVGINAISARIRVDGDSMVPTLANGEYIIISRLSYRFGTPQRGDIIVFHPPLSPQEEYIKRIIGLPGDEVRIEQGQIYINGQHLSESYIHQQWVSNGSWRVPAGQVFVLGDNRNNSQDSRSWGTVSMDAVVGKAILVYWPPLDWGLVGHVSLASALH